MTVWLHLLSISRLLSAIKKVGTTLSIVVIITAVVFPHAVLSAPNDNKTISFSARLKNSNGSVVPDGKYNVHFNLYTKATDGTPVWSETYFDKNGLAVGEDSRVDITNGYMQVRLGAESAFANIDWSNDLWLTMMVGGTAQTASASDTGWNGWDGEMNPRIQLSAVPHAMNSGTVGGKSADQLVQLGQGKQTDASTGTSSIFIDKTGEAGDLIELQTAGINVFTLDRTGSIAMGSVANQSISVADTANGSGKNLTIAAGSSADSISGNGGDLILNGGNASADTATGGGVSIDAGGGGLSGEGGSISIGETNASKITIGNTNSSTVINGNLQSGSLDTAENSTILSIGQDNATSIDLYQDTTIADGKTLTVGGDTTIKSSLDNSEQALQVQNKDGAAQLTVDTLNSQVRIGVNDTIASLLVLDTKNTEGDPAGGINGAMYYNSVAGKFRCYQGSWTDCITPLPVSKTVDSEHETVADNTASDVQSLEFNLAANTKYYYKFMVISDTEVTNTGLGFGVSTPLSPVSNHWCVNTKSLLGSAEQSAPGWGSYCGTGDINTTTNGTDSPGNMHSSTMEGYIETGEQAGVLKLRAKSETTDNITVREGSFGILQIVQ